MKTMPPLEKRTWIYLQPPREYAIAGCSCGNEEVEWSEYKERLWCARCKKDFIPEHWGVFDGPISITAARLMGMCFDQFNLETEKIEPFQKATERCTKHPGKTAIYQVREQGFCADCRDEAIAQARKR